MTSTALLVAGRSEHHELEALLRSLGFQPLLVAGPDEMPASREPVALCLIDLRENGESIRSARAFCTQYPQSFVIGVAYTTAGNHGRAVARVHPTCCRGRPRRAISKRCSQTRVSRRSSPPERRASADRPMAYGMPARRRPCVS